MSSPFCNYLDALRQFTASVLREPVGYFMRPHRDFTRRRSLWFERVVWLNISLLKVTLSVEMDRFFAVLDSANTVVTKSALVQARQKLLPLFFEDFFKVTVLSFYGHFKVKRWGGFRLWAADGSGFRLPDEAELGVEFGWHGNQHNRVPSSRMFVFYDLLNKIVTRLAFHPRDFSEVFMALCAVAEVPCDVLMVYDRGYASHIIPFLHQYFGSNCVIRLRLDFSNTVKAFVLSGKRQQTITEKVQIKAHRWLSDLKIEVAKDATITYRLIRIDLPTGETEILLTTLLDKNKYHWAQFCAVYRNRWGIETCFFVIKSYLQLGNFSSISTNNCWQDIYSHFILYNLQTVFHVPLEKKIRAVNAKRKHDYQPNRNVSAGLLHRFLLKIFLCSKAKQNEHVQEYHRQILQTMEPIRPGKTKERPRKMMRGTERHAHEKNYRRAF